MDADGIKKSIYIFIFEDNDWVMNIYENGEAKGYSGKERIIEELNKL